MPDNIEVTNNAEKNRFEVELDGHLAMIEYNIAGKNIVYTHTEVPPEFEGQGIATIMAHEAMEFARNEGYKVQALCPFVKNYVIEHPEYHDITWGFTKRKS